MGSRVGFSRRRVKRVWSAYLCARSCGASVRHAAILAGYAEEAKSRPNAGWLYYGSGMNESIPEHIRGPASDEKWLNRIKPENRVKYAAYFAKVLRRYVSDFHDLSPDAPANMVGDRLAELAPSIGQVFVECFRDGLFDI